VLEPIEQKKRERKRRIWEGATERGRDN